ncbi:zinc-ribbon domain-containing protein [Bifidobacterium sp. ESL0800]|uniref:zinc-ribbon domain-containing protein n=1 Tax=Bifidobacterium sp. ESL0800 TaxID=2983236 RepID=UPI0023F9EE66|nr:zinc-ribbon domain-containing protein [Bifidobacterium sp. ESL0800]WEV75432.1 zinc-ribbon domain-containing protein [Bifidobacterium sp. ESL0800]
MRFCTNCGHPLADDEEFCGQCGTPAPTAQSAGAGSTSNAAGNTNTSGKGTAGSTAAADNAIPPLPGSTQPVPAPTAPAGGQVPLPHTSPSTSTVASGTASPAATAAVTTAAKTQAKKKLTIIIAAVVAVVLVVTGVGFGTYKAEIWGGKTIPGIADLGVKKSAKTHEFTTADVEYSLHERGFKTATEQVFSPKPKGTFLKYRNVTVGKRYNVKRNPVILTVSAGPGVPKGTKGKPVQDVTDSLKSMGVPVHYHKVIARASRHKEGTVVATYPADGKPVVDTDHGIDVGVATIGHGISYDVLGMDKDKAQKEYASPAWIVKLMPRFSSKKMIGKIVDTYPKPGTASEGGGLILFYGIDASGMDDAVKDEYDKIDGKVIDLWSLNAPVGGKYCTNAGKCLTLKTKVDSILYQPYVTVSSSEIANPYDHLAFCHAGGDPACSLGNEYGEHGELYYRHLGAFELMSATAMNQIKCGDHDDVGRTSRSSRCVAGQVVPYDGSDSSMSGATYEMGPLYVYFPVGSKVKSVVDSGYFDKDATAKAKKQKAVDTSRPFLISRDKSLYKTTSVNVPDMRTPNPFIPEMYKKDNGTLVPMKPAPSDETAYYLIDDPLDWDALPDFDITKAPKKQAAGKSGSSAKKPNKGYKPRLLTKDSTPDQIIEALENNDFGPIAGDYCNTAKECVHISRTGILTGISGADELSVHNGSHLALAENVASTRTPYKPKSSTPYLNLRGPDSEYGCQGGKGLDQCADVTIPEMTSTPTDLIYVFKGADTSSWYQHGNSGENNPGFLDAEGDKSKPAPTTMPYIFFMNSHSSSMLDPPRKDTVYYLQQ